MRLKPPRLRERRPITAEDLAFYQSFGVRFRCATEKCAATVAVMEVWAYERHDGETMERQRPWCQPCAKDRARKREK